MLTRRSAVAGLSAAGLPLFAPALRAQTFTRPIRLIVPFAPGGTSDILARLIGPRLSHALGQPVVVDNRPSASGNVGADFVAQNIFTTAPTFMIMFLAALQDINPAVYEAAAIDGATGWQRFRRITLPLLRPIIILVIVLGTIGTLQVFDQIFLATSGGPLGTTNTPVYEVFTRALGKLGPIEMGYGAALAFILGAIIFVFTFIQRRYLERGTEQY